MGLGDLISDLDKFVTSSDPLSQDQQNQFKQNGFILPSNYSADGNGLPFSKTPSQRPSQPKRNIITWYVPEFGIVKMYVNPKSISYNHRKIISKEKTKGGYSLQYWGEELTTLTLQGTTGSSGIEGINVLYEIYRAEQYAFDGTGLTLAANNSNPSLFNSLLGGAGSSSSSLLGGIGGSLLGGAADLLGMDTPNSAIVSNSINSLAQLAFTVEMYYNGWVYRGFFEEMTVTESADNFLMDYNIKFTATQRRGYRLNSFPFQRSPNEGPSEYGTPNSLSGFLTGT